MPITVALAEDSYLMREGLRSLLDELEGVELVATAEDYDGLLAAVAEHSPQAVITDIRMPPTQTDEGIRAAIEIRAKHPGTGVVVLSQYAEPEYAIKLFADGAAGLAYLLKERVGDLKTLAQTMNEVTRGGSRVDPEVVDLLVAARSREAKSLLDRLTPRELDVLSEMAKGFNNAAIAEALYVSQRAVEKHINSIFTKLDLSAEEATHHRVRAVLLYLVESNG